MEMWKWKIKFKKLLAHKSIPVTALDFKVCFVSLHSLGVALSRGHGKYFFRGNVTIEEGKAQTWVGFSLGVGRKALSRRWENGRACEPFKPRASNLGTWVKPLPTSCFFSCQFCVGSLTVGTPASGWFYCILLPIKLWRQSCGNLIPPWFSYIQC